MGAELCVDVGFPGTWPLGAWGRRTLDVESEVVLQVGVKVDGNPKRLVSSQDALRPSHCGVGWLLQRVICRVDTIAWPPLPPLLITLPGRPQYRQFQVSTQADILVHIENGQPPALVLRAGHNTEPWCPLMAASDLPLGGRVRKVLGLGQAHH